MRRVMLPVFGPLAFVTAVTCAACSSSDDASVDAGTDANGAPTTPYIPSGYVPVPYLSDAPVRTFPKADSVLDATQDYEAVMETDVGRIVLDLYEGETPTTVNSFVFLALHHFYDGIAFHRVIDGFMAQTGDPNSLKADTSTWGVGGPGYTFALEVMPSLNFDGVGVLGMARSSKPDSNGSQFFITFGAATNLNQKYTVFGKVTEGLDILPKIVRGEPPTGATRIRTVAIVSKSK